MSKAETKDVLNFLNPFPDEIQDKVLWLREFVWDLYPTANELIYDNYNALAIGWSPTDKVGDTFCSIAVGRSSHNLHFGFYWGSRIADPEQKLLGKGNQYRYLLVGNKREFPKRYVTNLMKEAYAYSVSKMKEKHVSLHGATITKSVSAKKRSAGRKLQK